MLRRMICVLTIGVLGFAVNGCGESAEEGMPSNIDMSKDYSPKVDMPGMSPKIQKKAMSKKPAAAVPEK